jgi:hypothetical protein
MRRDKKQICFFASPRSLHYALLSSAEKAPPTANQLSIRDQRKNPRRVTVPAEITSNKISI